MFGHFAGFCACLYITGLYNLNDNLLIIISSQLQSTPSLPHQVKLVKLGLFRNKC